MYTNEELLNILKERAIELERTPRSREMKNPGGHIYIQKFGSWKNAIDMAGLEYNPKRNPNTYISPIRYSDEFLLNNLREKYQQTGSAPKYQDLKIPSITAYKNRFGNLKNALELAGIPTRPYHCSYSDKELLDNLKHKYEELGRLPTFKEIKNPTGYAYRKRFGNWKKAVDLAGLNYKANRRNTTCISKYTDEFLLDIIKEIHKQAGRIPKIADLKQVGEMPQFKGVKHITRYTYESRFGGWKKALILAGLK